MTNGRFGDKYNNEGYLDMTAYLAMQGGHMEYHKGDIVVIETNNGDEREMVLLSCHSEYATSVMLMDDVQENDHKVLGATYIKHTDVGRLTTTFYSRIVRYCKTMGDTEFDKLLAHVGKVLGTDIDTEPIIKEVPVETIKEVVKEVPVADSTEMLLKVARLEGERDVYKAMYESLLKGVKG